MTGNVDIHPACLLEPLVYHNMLFLALNKALLVNIAFTVIQCSIRLCIIRLMLMYSSVLDVLGLMGKLWIEVVHDVLFC